VDLSRRLLQHLASISAHAVENLPARPVWCVPPVCAVLPLPLAVAGCQVSGPKSRLLHSGLSWAVARGFIPRVVHTWGTRPRATVRKPGCRLWRVPRPARLWRVPAFHVPRHAAGLYSRSRPAVAVSRPNLLSVLSVLGVESRCLCLLFHSAFSTLHSPLFTSGPSVTPKKGTPMRLVKHFTNVSVFAKVPLTSLATPQKPLREAQNTIKFRSKRCKKCENGIKFRLAHLNILTRHHLWR
jgi:hypothetical protein